MGDTDQTLLSRSTRTASFLIGLQIGSRGLTFAVNQLLLRSLDASLLGLSSQLDLLVITVLTFSRESLRISLGRQDGDGHVKQVQSSDGAGEREKDAARSKPVGPTRNDLVGTSQKEIHLIKVQEAVNIAYLAPAAGALLSAFFGYLYYTYAPETVQKSPCIISSICIYVTAAFLELLAEPCFAVASREGLYSVRGRAEAIATVTRCVTTYGAMKWNIRSQMYWGTLPFALGQLCYAVSLNVTYWVSIIGKTRQERYVLWLQSPDKLRAAISPRNSERYARSVWAKPILVLAMTLYGQSILKHFLTQGDSFMVSVFTNLKHQGVYTLASNYGSLLARMLFQPIEESSRGVFGSLLGAATTAPGSHFKPPPERVSAARSYLITILKLYSLLGIVITSCGPAMAPSLLHLVAGKDWANTEAGYVLGIYCYYIPLLAFNGVFEAFVAATATPAQLRTQSKWMASFSVGFASAGFVFLRLLDMGSKGLVFANALNMVIRIFWSWNFMVSYFENQKLQLTAAMFAPRSEVLFFALVTKISLARLMDHYGNGIWGVAQSASVIGLFGVSMMFFERVFLIECFSLLRSSPSTQSATDVKKKD